MPKMPTKQHTIPAKPDVSGYPQPEDCLDVDVWNLERYARFDLLDNLRPFDPVFLSLGGARAIVEVLVGKEPVGDLDRSSAEWAADRGVDEGLVDAFVLRVAAAAADPRLRIRMVARRR